MTAIEARIISEKNDKSVTPQGAFAAIRSAAEKGNRTVTLGTMSQSKRTQLTSELERQGYSVHYSSGHAGCTGLNVSW
jgi:hypothetical protein